MNNTQIKTAKRSYIQPQVLCVELDNEISLALESAPPAGPDETYMPTLHDNSSTPFKA